MDIFNTVLIVFLVQALKKYRHEEVEIKIVISISF